MTEFETYEQALAAVQAGDDVPRETIDGAWRLVTSRLGLARSFPHNAGGIGWVQVQTPCHEVEASPDLDVHRLTLRLMRELVEIALMTLIDAGEAAYDRVTNLTFNHRDVPGDEGLSKVWLHIHLHRTGEGRPE